jgi:hypothetical protein
MMGIAVRIKNPEKHRASDARAYHKLVPVARPDAVICQHFELTQIDSK